MNRDNDKGKVLIRRSLIMALGKFFLLLVIVGRLYYLQVYQADRYKTLADENRISTRLLIPPRGVIYDRNGVMIATNTQNFQALIVAEQTPNVQETLDAFKKIMPLSADEEEKIKRDMKRNRSFVPIKIKENLTWEEVSRIQLNAADLPGIYIDEGLSRDYPFGPSMAHILGYVAAVNEKEAKQDDDPLLQVPGFKIGKSGIEKRYEKELRGKGGSLKLEVNAYGRIMKEIEKNDGIPEIKKISIAHQPPDVYQRQKQHQTETDGKTNQLVNRPRLPVAVGRRIKHNDADSRQRNNQQQISKAQVCQFFANGQRLIAKGCFIRLIHHSTVLTFSLTGSSFSVSSSSLEAIGAAAEEPPPPCSTKTATA
jgi:hypothetical protein